ncbi:Glyoxalase [uncultured Gammaproteobacteria bacterium]
MTALSDRSPSLIDHVSVGVTDIDRARAFYDRALAPMGIKRVMDFGQWAGYGVCKPEFWIGVPEDDGETVCGTPGTHIAFAAPNRAAVNAFFREALWAGGTDNGAPGLRPHYHPDYYGAFVIDPDGNRIEAVCHHQE